MTDVIPPQPQSVTASRPQQIIQPHQSTPQSALPHLASSSGIRSGHLNLDVFSPVNQNGSFEFDRVLKSGEQWKRFFLVLRPNLLSIYKNASEDKLHKQLNLSDLTAVATLTDPKQKREHIFGLFTPSKNYHFEAPSDKEARSWVDLIRKEARVDEEEEMILGGSPIQTSRQPQMLASHGADGTQEEREQERFASSSPEPVDLPTRYTTTRDGIRIPNIQKLNLHDLEYSGNDPGTQSDFSDTTPSAAHFSTSTPKPNIGSLPEFESSLGSTFKHEMPRSSDNQSGTITTEQENERVIWHGWLLCLKSKGGVRQWKRLWTVLRPKNLAFYKSEEEYAAILIIPLSSMINAVEIDPVSRSKPHCMQIIVAEKSYRFCAPSEEALARWLGALKSQLAKKVDGASGLGVGMGVGVGGLNSS